MTKKSLDQLLAARKELEDQLAATPKAELIEAAKAVLERKALKDAAADLLPIIVALPEGDADRHTLATVLRVLRTGRDHLGAEERRAKRKAARPADGEAEVAVGEPATKSK